MCNDRCQSPVGDGKNFRRPLLFVETMRRMQSRPTLSQRLVTALLLMGATAVAVVGFQSITGILAENRTESSVSEQEVRFENALERANKAEQSWQREREQANAQRRRDFERSLHPLTKEDLDRLGLHERTGR